jgi:hypothetical protein
MKNSETLVAVFPDHAAAENAVRILAQAGFDLKSLSVVGHGYHSAEKIVGFYNVGDRVKFWGQRGAFWGGLWGLFFGGLFIATPPVGPVFVLGSLAATAISAVEGAIVVGGLSAVGAALYSVGIPRDSVVAYETAIEADEFLVMAHGDAAEASRAKAVLGPARASRIDVFVGTGPVDEETDAILANC